MRNKTISVAFILVCVFLATLRTCFATPVATEPRGEWLPQSDFSFDWLKLGSDFVCVDDDSIELVIGINDAHPAALAELEDLIELVSLFFVCIPFYTVG